MRQKARKLVTYGRTSSSDKLRKHTEDLSAALQYHVSSDKEEDVGTTPAPSSFSSTKAEGRRNAAARDNILANNSLDRHTSDSQDTQEESSRMTSRKRRKLPVAGGLLPQPLDFRVDTDRVPFTVESASDKDEISGEVPEFDGNKAHRCSQRTKEQEQHLRTFPLEIHGGTVGSATTMEPPTLHSIHSADSFRKGKNTSKRNPDGVDRKSQLPLVAGEDRKIGSTRKRLVDSLGTSDDPATTGLSAPLSNAETQNSSRSISGQTGRYPSPRAGLDAHESRVSTNNVNKSPTSVSSRPRGSKVTYARQRSFLNNTSLMVDAGDGESSPAAISRDFALKRSYSSSASQFPSRVDGDDDESNDNRPVRSIHELRQAGDNARFRETVDLIFEDIEDPFNSVPERCHGLAQLCIKLLEPRFARRFSEYGFDERLMGCTTISPDIVPMSLILCAYNVIYIRGSFTFALLGAFWSNILEFSLLLDVEDDLLCLVEQQTTNLSKIMQTSLRKNLLQLLTAMYGEEPLPKSSPRHLVLSSIQLSLLKFRDKGHSIEPIPLTLLRQLIGLLTRDDSETATPARPSQRFELMTLVFSILESYTILSGTLSHDQCISFRPLSRFHSLLSYHSHHDRQILGLYIRVIINITNNDSSLCNDFATRELVAGLVRIVTTESSVVLEDSHVKENSSLNIAILALGALINLTEKCESSRAIFLGPTGNSLSFLQTLLQQFSSSINTIEKANSVPEVHHNVVIGYLSILLATLCQTTEAFSQVKESLDGQGLTLVLSTAEEFLRYHQEVERDSHPFEIRDGSGTSFTRRLERIISQIHTELDNQK